MTEIEVRETYNEDEEEDEEDEYSPDSLHVKNAKYQQKIISSKAWRRYIG